MTPLVVENEPPVTFLRRKITGGRFSMGVVIRRYTGCLLLHISSGGQKLISHQYLKSNYFLSGSVKTCRIAAVNVFSLST